MSQRKTWDRVKMKEAVTAVKNKEMGLLKASKIFDVPRSTLKDYVKKPVEDIQELIEVPLGRKPILSKELEDELVDYCLQMESSYYGLTSRDLRRMAFQLAMRNNIPHPFSAEKESAGRKWQRLFFKRHPALVFRKPQPLSLARIQGFTKENVDNFFSILKPELEKVKSSAARVFNVDETGVTTVQHKSLKIISVKGKREVHKLSSAERGRLVTMVTCMSASGIFVPPLLVFPRKRMKQELLDGAPPGTIGDCHISGWIQTDIFTRWFGHFVNFVKASKDDPVVLVFDGHTTHTKNIDVIDMARENGVSLVCLPPHSSNRMQPLDKTFMKPFKTFYAQEIENWLTSHPFRAVTMYQIGQLIGNAYIRAATMDIAIKGFQCTGILPYNPQVFSEVDFLSHRSEVAEEEARENAIESSSSQCSLADKNQPSTSKSTFSDGSSSSHLVSPKDIVPLPKMIAKKTSSRAGSSALVSGSPFKNALISSLNKKKLEPKLLNFEEPKKKRQAVSQKNCKKNKKPPSSSTKNTCDSSSDEEEPDYVSTDDNDSSCYDSDDAECSFCNGYYSKDKQGEKWIKCINCCKWSHEACDPRKNKVLLKNYVCPFCV